MSGRWTVHGVRWIMQRLVLQLMPVIATYLERGGVAALSMVAIWFARAVHRLDEMKPLQLEYVRLVPAGTALSGMPEAGADTACCIETGKFPKRITESNANNK
jgi:hypothetical protein